MDTWLRRLASKCFLKLLIAAYFHELVSADFLCNEKAPTIDAVCQYRPFGMYRAISHSHCLNFYCKHINTYFPHREQIRLFRSLLMHSFNPGLLKLVMFEE